jgi:EpsI family protein
MGSTLTKKLVVLILLFIITSLLIYQAGSPSPAKKTKSLSQALSDIPNWESRGFFPIEKEIIKALELDDYANQGYSNGQDSVFLYIGYYFNKGKIGAAHDPLVCFPGQGWVASNVRKGGLSLNPHIEDTISYSSMIVQRGLQKELIIYWFQAFDKTTPDTFSQKATLLWKAIFDKREDNAFVRITITIDKKSVEECRDIIFQFIGSFYPVFLEYVKG